MHHAVWGWKKLELVIYLLGNISAGQCGTFGLASLGDVNDSSTVHVEQVYSVLRWVAGA
jgi:hypothetical protein